MKDISIDKRVITIKELLHRIDFSKIIISKHDRMDVKSQRELIESILLGLPLNNFVFISDKNGVWNLEVGNTVVNTLISFATGELDLRELKILTECNDLTMDSIPGKFYNKFYETEISCVVINPNTPRIVQLELANRYINIL